MVRSEQKYNVYIVENETGKAVSLIGENLRGERADRRFETGLERINRDKFWIESPKAGSEDDIRFAADVKEYKSDK